LTAPRYLLVFGLVFWLWTRAIKPLLQQVRRSGSERAPPPNQAAIHAHDEAGVTQQSYETKLAGGARIGQAGSQGRRAMIKDWVGHAVATESEGIEKQRHPAAVARQGRSGRGPEEPGPQGSAETRSCDGGA
jgi:hypothetical protein